MKRSTYETFLAVARLSHFRKAADHLNTTQSTVSARIADLERHLSVQLFRRDASGVFLTPVGRELIPQAEAILDAMDRFATAAGRDPDQEGTLRLALSETLAATLLPEIMKVFTRTYPRVTVELTIDNSVSQRRLLLDRSIDVALLIGPISDPGVVNLPLLSLPMVWAVARGHPAAMRGRVTVDELAEGPIVTYLRGSRPYLELEAALKSAGIGRPRLFSSNALSATLGMVRSGLGIGTLPEIFARSHIAAGTIVGVDADIPLCDQEFTASYLQDTASRLTETAADIACRAAAGLEADLIAKSDR